MKRLGKIWYLILLMGCSPSTLSLPDRAPVSLRMATVGIGNFEDYIHSLAVYAFRKTADGNYVYYKTLADLDEQGIAALGDISGRGNSKLLGSELRIGTYEIYFVGNGAGRIAGSVVEDVTLPGEVRLKGSTDGQEAIYFLGRIALQLVGDAAKPLFVTLNRAVSKTIVVLHGVPPQIDTIGLSLNNIAADIGIDGTLSGQGQTVTKAFNHPDRGGKDSVVYELLTLPAIQGSAPFSITFHTVSGEEKTRELPPLALVPDKYVRVTGEISDSPGAFLSFQVTVTLETAVHWQGDTLPDFSLKPFQR